MTTSFHIDWKAATWAGIIAGMVFLVLEMIMVPVFGGGSPWAPPRMMAAIVLGEGVLPPPATFDAGIIMAAMGLHLVLSVVYAIVFAVAVSRLSLGKALILGGFGGLVLYLVNFYGFTALFPWFAMARNWISIFGHVVFGLVAAGAYVAIRIHHQHEDEGARAPLREKKA
jgi:uncharacterized membrane protein YagU involved in acid resistance